MICIYVIFLTIFGFRPNNNGRYQYSALISNGISSDSAIVSGRIFDLKTVKALPYSMFEVKDLKVGCSANDSGYFEMKIKSGEYKLRFFSIGNGDIVTPSLKIDGGKKYYFSAYLYRYQLY